MQTRTRCSLNAQGSAGSSSRWEAVLARFPDQFTESLLELTNLMIAEESLEDTLQRITALACRTIAGCEHASLTLQRRDGPRTVAATDDVAERCDEVQYQSDGPCLMACRSGQRVHVWNIELDDRFPRFTATALETGVRSSLSIPLEHASAPSGALNLYASSPQAFDADAEELAGLFSRQSAVAIANAEIYWRTYDLTQDLQAALDTRDVIGQAKGILMARHKLTGDDAFDLLRVASQRRNEKLRVIAEEVVATGELEGA